MKVAKVLLILLSNYFIGWIISYIFIYGADNFIIDGVYRLDFSFFFSDLVKVWTGNAFARAAFVQLGAVIIFIVLTLVYGMALLFNRRKK